MTPRSRQLTDEEKARARELYGRFGSWAKVAPHFGMGVTAFRDRMGVTPQRRNRRVHSRVVVRSQSRIRRDGALYDPHRDAPPTYANEANAVVLGDPPLGRREMLEENAARTDPKIGAPPTKFWHL